jgi:hypothetical protein
MAKIAGLDIVFTVNGESVEIGSEALANLVYNLRDNKVYKLTYAEFAKSSAYEVRENVAGKENLDEETVFILANDPVESVVENLLGSEAARCLNDDILTKLIDRSPKLAGIVAGRVGSFEECNINNLCELLANHNDPMVRRNLAGNYSAPKKFLKKLKSDEDPEVSDDAQRSLE